MSLVDPWQMNSLKTICHTDIEPLVVEFVKAIASVAQRIADFEFAAALFVLQFLIPFTTFTFLPLAINFDFHSNLK